MLSALLLVVAEFAPLFHLHVQPGGTPGAAPSAGSVKSVSAGSHNSYALILIALLVGALTYGVAAYASRAALVALAALGVITILIAILGDFPDAHRTGLTQGNVIASSTPAAGLYLETLGGVVLLLTGGLGFAMLDMPRGGGPGGGAARP